MAAVSAHACLMWYQAMGVTDPVGLLPVNRLQPIQLIDKIPKIVAATKPISLMAAADCFPDIPTNISGIADFNAWLTTNTHSHSLAKTAQQAVIGAGAQTPQIVFVAEAPDRAEDQSGQAWQTPELQWLQKAWALAAPHMAENTYYMYVSPWRPPGQRPLTPNELAYCQKLLQQQLQWLNPKFVLCLGANVAKTLSLKPIKNNEKQWLDTSILDNNLTFRLAPLPNAKNMLMSALSKKAAWQQLLVLTAQI